MAARVADATLLHPNFRERGVRRFGDFEMSAAMTTRGVLASLLSAHSPLLTILPRTSWLLTKSPLAGCRTRGAEIVRGGR